MTAAELMKPRFEVIADYPNSILKVGVIIDGDDPNFCRYDFTEYPHIFRELKWWEYRSIGDMPKKLISKATSKNIEAYEIQEWDMGLLIGWIDKHERSCCSLLTWRYEYGYFPVD